VDEILAILMSLQRRAERQIHDFDRGTVVVVGVEGSPILSNLEYSEMLHSQLLDLNEVIELLTQAATARQALADS
jgi:hypothetical protein